MNTTKPNDVQYISPKQMAQQYTLSLSKVYDIIKSDPDFHAVHIGRRILIPADEPERWLRSQQINTQSKSGEPKRCRTIRLKKYF